MFFGPHSSTISNVPCFSLCNSFWCMREEEPTTSCPNSSGGAIHSAESLCAEVGCWQLASLVNSVHYPDFFSVTSPRFDLVARSGCSVDLVRTIDHSKHFAQRTQSSYRFEQLDLSKLMHKTSVSVFRRNDFSSVMQAL